MITTALREFCNKTVSCLEKESRYVEVDSGKT